MVLSIRYSGFRYIGGAGIVLKPGFINLGLENYIFLVDPLNKAII